jgi:enoyl-CoA hydratase/carnithine racemase
MTANYQHLIVGLLDGIATVELSRPPVNAVSMQMYGEIYRLFADIDHLGEVRAVVLLGRGKHFCAGNDLHEFATMTTENARERMFHVREAFSAIYCCAVPVIAAVHGAVLGTGLAIAASCDFIVAAEDTQFGTPEVGVGVMGAARHLSRLIPQGHARMLYYTAEPIGARQMHALGAVVEVVSQDELSAVANRYARTIARHSPVVLRAAKQALNTVEDMNLAHGYEYEQGLTVALADHPHSREARRATLARRSPDYATPDAPTGSDRLREDDT